MFKKILVALSEHELDSILETPVFNALSSLQLAPNSKIVLGHVVPVNALELERGMDQHHESESILQDKILQVKTTLETQLDRAFELEVASGEPSEEIVRLANIHHADLVVLGSRGLKGVNRVLNQSVSSQVSEDAPCSVLVVKDGEH